MIAHLASSPEPLKRGSDIEAACRQLIFRADFLMEQDRGEECASALRFCPQCMERFVWDRYNYVIAQGEDVKQLEAA